jgi:hypothetical protein
MAYKFQLGAAKLSGSIEQTDGSSIKAQTEFQIGSVAVSETELGILEGASVSTAELNYLDNDDLEAADMQKLADLTATAAELNLMDGVVATTIEINKLSGLTADTSELNLVDGSSAGNVASSKAVIYGASGEIVANNYKIGGNDVIDTSGNGAFGNVEVDGFLSASSYVSASAISLLDASGLAGAGLVNNAGELDLDLSGLPAITSNIITASDLLAVYDADASLSKKMTHQEYVQALVDADNGSVASGLSESGSKLQVNVDDSSIEISSNSMQVKALGITNAMLAGSIENAKLSNSDVSFGGVTVALGASDATPAFDLSDATSYPGDSSLVTAGALNAGSITSGFGSINNGSSAITTTGTGSFGKIIVSGDLEVQGALTYIDTTNLRVSDAKVVFADGASALAAGQGWYIGSDAGDATEKASFAVNLDVDGAGTDGFESSLPIKASRFYGEFVGASVETVNTVSATGTLDPDDGSQVLADASAGSITLTLPGASQLQGLVYKIKRSEGSANSVTISAPAGTIDGAGSVVLDSPYSAINIISDGTNYYIV